jgi:hypothetical protein
MNEAIVQPAFRAKIARRPAVHYARRLAVDARLFLFRLRHLHFEIARFLIQLPEPLGSQFLEFLRVVQSGSPLSDPKMIDALELSAGAALAIRDRLDRPNRRAFSFQPSRYPSPFSLG